MNPKPTSTALALALALSATTFVESNSISTTGEVKFKSSGRQNDGIKKSNDQRRAEQQIISNTLHGISIHGSTIEVVDVGILAVEEDGHRHHDTMPLFRQRGVKVKVAASFSTVPRFLQEGEPTCAYPDTCEPNLCACTAKGGYVYDCAAELNAVCNKVYDDNGKVWTLEGCTGDVAYYANTYCPFAKCIVEGGAYGECSCQFYQNVCDLYGDRQKYADEPNVIQSCAAATSCCQNKTDEDGRRSCVENAHNASTTSSTTTSSGESGSSMESSVENAHNASTTSSTTTSSGESGSSMESSVENAHNASTTSSTMTSSGESGSSMESSPIASSNVPAPTTSSGQGLMVWNNARASSSLTVAAVACSILC